MHDSLNIALYVISGLVFGLGINDQVLRATLNKGNLMHINHSSRLGRFKNFYARNLPLGNLLFFFAITAAYPIMGTWFGAILFGLLLGTVALAFVMKISERYDDRIRAEMKDDDAKWIVCVNKVKVGELTDGEFAQLQKNVLLDIRTYLGQLGNLVNGIYRAACNLVRLIPSTAFWGAVVLLAFDADSVRQALSTLHAASPAELQEYAVRAMRLLSLVALTALMLGVVVGFVSANALGFESKFDLETYASVLRKVKCAATGDVVIYRQSSSILHRQDNQSPAEQPL